MNCKPCAERGHLGVPAKHDVAGTPMCSRCFHGGSSVPALAEVDRPDIKTENRGRRAVGWIGGKAAVEAVLKLDPGMGKAIQFVVPRKIPFDRVRSGIYRAATLRGLRVCIYRDHDKTLSPGLSKVRVWRRQ